MRAPSTPPARPSVLGGSPAQMRARVRAFAAVGVEELAVGFEPRHPDAFGAALLRFDREVVRAADSP